MKKNSYFLVFLAMFCMPCVQGVPISFGAGTAYGPVYVGHQTDSNISSYTLAVVVGLVVAGKIAYDVSWHAEYVARVQNCYGSLKKCIDRHSVTTVEDSALQELASRSMKCEVVFLEQSLRNSYGSWLCPWNWTAQQKAMYHQIQVVAILTLYADLIALGDKVTGADVVQCTRQLFVPVSLYPCVHCYGELRRHISFIQSLSYCDVLLSNIETSLLRGMVPYLEQFVSLLAQQNEYVQELQTMKTHELQKEMNNNLMQALSRRH